MTDLEVKIKALEMVFKNFQPSGLKHQFKIADEIYNHLKFSLESKAQSTKIKSTPVDINYPDCIRLINLHGNTFVLRVGKTDYCIEITKDNRFLCNDFESHSVTIDI